MDLRVYNDKGNMTENEETKLRKSDIRWPFYAGDKIR
jgi:hypothetical protein